MNKEELEDEREYWLDEIFFLSHEKAVTTHLLFSLLVQKEIKGSRKDNSGIFMEEYLKKSTALIKDSLKEAAPARTPFDETIANFVFVNVLKYALDAKTYDAMGRKLLYMETITHINENYKDIIGGKTFAEYFSDLTFNERGRMFSKKAEDLMTKYMKVVSEEKDYDGAEDGGNGGSNGTFLVSYYNESWEKVYELLNEIPVENALVFHAIALLICKEFLEPKAYAKYHKAVVRAITAYKQNANDKQKEFALSNANEAYDKLKDSVLASLEDYHKNPVDEDYYYTWDTFTLATDKCLKSVSEMNPEQCHQIICDITADSENFYTNDQVVTLWHQNVSDTDLIMANLVCDEDTPDENGEYDDEDAHQHDEENDDQFSGDDAKDESNDTPESALEAYNQQYNDFPETGFTEFLEKATQTLPAFEIEKDLFYHVIALNVLVSRGFQHPKLDSYKDAIRKELECCNRSADPVSREDAHEKADEILIMILSDIADIEKEDSSGKDVEVDLFYSYMVYSMGVCLCELTSLENEVIAPVTKKIKYDHSRGEFYSEATDAYALKYQINASFNSPEFFCDPK